VGSAVVHFEIGCRNSEQTARFYTTLFDWKASPYGPAQMIDTQSEAGIRGHITTLGHEPHNYVLLYAQVDDLQSYLDKAEKLGAKTLITPTEVPGMGHFAWLKDPEGTIFGLWKPMAPGA
jgi:predicted enzyme related to lactoylglutathione lyase